jgi:hypothetical protein
VSNIDKLANSYLIGLERKADSLRKELNTVRLLIELIRKHNKWQSPPIGKKSTKQQSIIEGCAAILSDGKRRLSRELLPELEKLGIIVGGKNPKSLLASYLSAAGGFESVIKLGGWKLLSPGTSTDLV